MKRSLNSLFSQVADSWEALLSWQSSIGLSNSANLLADSFKKGKSGFLWLMIEASRSTVKKPDVFKLRALDLDHFYFIKNVCAKHPAGVGWSRFASGGAPTLVPVPACTSLRLIYLHRPAMPRRDECVSDRSPTMTEGSIKRQKADEGK
jgi:hypothetical protein